VILTGAFPMRHVLLVFALVVFAMPAAAQITAGPMGPFAVVDDNGKLMGGFDSSNSYGPTGSVSIETPLGSGFVSLKGGSLLGFDDDVPNHTYFTTSDCTGQAYGQLGSGRPVDGGWGVQNFSGNRARPIPVLGPYPLPRLYLTESLLIGRRQNAA